LTSDVAENREVMDGAGYTFRRGDAADLADRLRFLIANPAVREAAGQAARRRIQERYQWDKIAVDIETAYFKIMGEAQVKAARKPMARATVTDASKTPQRRAG
jgi:D-inositol-3-phosphate glycosyltransferase